MKSTKLILLFLMGLLSVSCTLDEVDYKCNYKVDIPVDVNKSTRAVVSENTIKVSDASSANWEVYASNGTDWQQITDVEPDDATVYTIQPWIDDPVTLCVLGTEPSVIETNIPSSYITRGTYEFDATHSNIKATAEVVDTKYLRPMSVAFYGIYPASVTATLTSSNAVTSSDLVYENDKIVEAINYTLAWTNSEHKAQYAVAGFAPTFTVADKIKVKTSASQEKEVSSSDYPFTIQYIYVGSSKSVTYGMNYDYTPGDPGVTKVGLPNGGVFAGNTKGTVGGWTDYIFGGFNINTTTYMTLLPIKFSQVEVTLCCWNCGTKTIYTKSGKSIRPGSMFYIQGTLTKGATVSNSTNPDCEAAGVTGVFMPDVITSVTINITTLANCESNVNPEPGFTTSFSADVLYGGMTGEYTEK